MRDLRYCTVYCIVSTLATIAFCFSSLNIIFGEYDNITSPDKDQEIRIIASKLLLLWAVFGGLYFFIRQTKDRMFSCTQRSLLLYSIISYLGFFTITFNQAGLFSYTSAILPYVVCTYIASLYTLREVTTSKTHGAVCFVFLPSHLLLGVFTCSLFYYLSLDHQNVDLKKVWGSGIIKVISILCSDLLILRGRLHEQEKFLTTGLLLFLNRGVNAFGNQAWPLLAGLGLCLDILILIIRAIHKQRLNHCWVNVGQYWLFCKLGLYGGIGLLVGLLELDGLQLLGIDSPTLTILALTTFSICFLSLSFKLIEW